MTREELLIKELNLSKHPEGGYYKETYRSQNTIPHQVLGNTFSGERNYCTSIYFLLISNEFSAFHKINQDELWNYHEGTSIKIHQISPSGTYSSVILGTDILKGEQHQHVVPANYWFGATIEKENSYSLVGCTVAPGFDFADFVLADRKELVHQFPQHKDIIIKLTH